MAAPRNPSGRLTHGGMNRPDRPIDLRYIIDTDHKTVRRECDRVWREVVRMGLDTIGKCRKPINESAA